MHRLMLSGFLFLLSVPTQAQPVKELSEFTSSEVARLIHAVEQGLRASQEDREARDWDFKRFLLRITAKVAFDIDVVKLELLPELELVFQKEGTSGI